MTAIGRKAIFVKVLENYLQFSIIFFFKAYNTNPAVLKANFLKESELLILVKLKFPWQSKLHAGNPHNGDLLQAPA